jgi:hypothetical protein
LCWPGGNFEERAMPIEPDAKMPAEPAKTPAEKDFSATPYAATFQFGGGEPVRLQAFAAEETAPEPVAVLVCHGMGQQVRFETIGQIGAAILKQAQAAGCTVDANGVHLLAQETGFLARTELNWRLDGKPHQAHVYEAYWAPVTEGKVTYAETLQFLFQAAWRGFRCSRFFRKATFQRWMFDGMQDMTIAAGTKIMLVVVALVLGFEALSIAFVTLRVAAGVKLVASMAWPAMPALHDATVGSVARFFWQDLLQLLKPFVPQHAALHHPASAGEWGRAAAKTVGWFVLIAQGFFMRYFLIEYAGDVAAYVSPFKDSKFDSIRSEIQAIGLKVARVIYGFDPVAGVPHYKKIVMVGHSLGSVLAYDTLNAILNSDLVSPTPGSRKTVERTTHLITFGSPLDKTAFLFRNQSNHIADPIREQMAAGYQPLIRSYELFRKRLTWINLWSKMDIVSGKLEYYDVVPEDDKRHIQNMPDPDAHTPLAAHTQYWGGRLLAETLYDAVK